MTHRRGPRNTLRGSLPWFISATVVSTRIHSSLPEKPNHPVSVGLAAHPSGVWRWGLAADGLGDGLTMGHVLLCGCQRPLRFREIRGTGSSPLDAAPALLDVWAVLHGRQEDLPLVGERPHTKASATGGLDPNRKTPTRAANRVQSSPASWK